MKMTIKVSNHSLTPEEFNLVCFFLQMAHGSCNRVDDGVLFTDIPVEEKRRYDDMGCEATTEEYFRWKIKDIYTRALMFRGDPCNVNKSYALDINYKEG